jgi:hypothetical protein
MTICLYPHSEVSVWNYRIDFFANMKTVFFSLKTLSVLSLKENVRFCIFADIDSNGVNLFLRKFFVSAKFRIFVAKQNDILLACAT